MASILNHLMHPLTYKTPNGRVKSLTPTDTSYVTGFFLLALTATVVEARYSSRSLKSSLVILIPLTGVFYVATAILKALDRGEIAAPTKKNLPISPATQSTRQSEQDFGVRQTWIDDKEYSQGLIAIERDYFASLWTRMYGSGLDVWIKEVESGDDEKFRNGTFTATPGQPWAEFADHARKKLLEEWKNKGPLRRMFAGVVPFF